MGVIRVIKVLYLPLGQLVIGLANVERIHECRSFEPSAAVAKGARR